MTQQNLVLADRLNASMALTAELFNEMRQTIVSLSSKVDELTKVINNDYHTSDRFITVDDAAKMMGVSTRTIERMINNGEIPAWKNAKAIRVSYNFIQSIIKPKI